MKNNWPMLTFVSGLMGDRSDASVLTAEGKKKIKARRT